MQFLKLPYELITDTNITSNEFRIYTYLLSLYNAQKNCAYPSIEIISKRVGISERTISTSIKNLFKLVYMTIEKKKGINGNFNTYKEFKHLIKGIVKVTKNVVKTASEKPKEVIKRKKTLIVSDYKESGVQIEIEEIIPFSIEHQQKISLVLKYVKELTEKQMWLIGDMDLETLRKAILRFKKSSKTNTFAFLVTCYYTECALSGYTPSIDLQRYCGNKFIPVPKEIQEREELKALMIKEGIFDEEEWNKNIMAGL